MTKWMLSRLWKEFKLDVNDTIEVCAECGQASCWLGEFYCEKAKTANTVIRRVGELLKSGLMEHPNYLVKARLPRTRLDDGPMSVRHRS